MGIIPNTGSEIKMGLVRNAYGLTGTVKLNANLGAQLGVAAGASTPLSITFGGQTTPNNYA